MRIAFFTDTYHPTLDGVVRSIDRFADELRRQGHEVRVFAPAPAEVEHRREQENAAYAPSIPFPPYPQYRMPVWTGEVAEQAVAWKPDIIHSHAMLAMGLAAREAAKKSGAPLVGTFHTQIPSAMHYLSPDVRVQAWAAHASWRYLRWFYSPFDLLIAPSRHQQREIARHRLRSHVVPNPVDTKLLTPGRVDISVARMVSKSGARHPLLLCLGRVAREKNLDYLLELAASKSWEDWGAHLVIAGDGPYREELEEKVRERRLGGRVHFIGRIPDGHLASIYRAADFTLLPSKFETQGLVAIESLSCGTPVAVLKGTALAEVAREGTSGVRMSGDVKSDVNRLRLVMGHHKRFSIGARKVALEFSVPSCTKKLLAAYRKAMKENRKKKQ